MPGYPDYARLAQQGGTQLFATTAAMTHNLIVFQGFVGSWAYVNLHTNMDVSADSFRFILAYFSDSTFSTQVGFRYAIRRGASFASTQYANLTPWMQFFVDSQTGNPIPVIAVGLYATAGQSDQKQLTSLDVPLLSDNPNIAAGAHSIYFPVHVQPGDGVMIFSSPVNLWNINVFYWDYASNAWKLYAQFAGGTFGTGFSQRLPMIDSPVQVDIHNTDGVAHQVNITWLSG